MIDWTYSGLTDPATSGGQPAQGGDGTAELAASYTSVDLTLQYAEVALDAATGDVEIPVRIIKGAEAIAQRIRVRFKFFLGEWFLDQRQGVPYFRDVLRKNPDQILISSILRSVVARTPGILRVTKWETRWDRAERTFYVNFEAILADGSTILRAVDEPFILG